MNNRRVVLLTGMTLFYSLAQADTVTMKNGDVFRGTIVKQEPGQYLQLRFKDDNEKRLTWSEIDKVEADAPGAQLGNSAAPPLGPVSPAPVPPAPVPPAPMPPSGVPGATTPAAAPVTTPVAAQPDEGRHPFHWHLKWNTGITLGNSDNGTLNDSTGAALASGSNTGPNALQIGAEVGYVSEGNPFGGSGVIEWNKYSPANSSVTWSELGLYFVPKVIESSGILHPWAGFGVGFVITTVSQSSETSSGVTLTFASPTSTNLAISPRVGVDLDLGERFTFGCQLAYTYLSGALPFTVVVNNQTANGTLNLNESWFGLSLSLGLRF